jgi:hypothetical protein
MRCTFGQVGLIISIGGMLVFALVVGIVAESISESIDGLRHGKTRVIESNHTVLLNWSSPHCQDDSLNESHVPALAYARICRSTQPQRRVHPSPSLSVGCPLGVNSMDERFGCVAVGGAIGMR